jgi:hypothetical protein
MEFILKMNFAGMKYDPDGGWCGSPPPDPPPGYKCPLVWRKERKPRAPSTGRQSGRRGASASAAARAKSAAPATVGGASPTGGSGRAGGSAGEGTGGGGSDDGGDGDGDGPHELAARPAPSAAFLSFVDEIAELAADLFLSSLAEAHHSKP